MRFHFLNSVQRGGGGDSIDASGGTITTETINGIDYKIHTFDVVGSDTFVINSISGTVTLEYLIVAGGGDGRESGGGAGGLLQGTLQKSDSTDILVTVGSGGDTNITGWFYGDGNDSAFGETITTGGGAGGAFSEDGGDGGSGGGGGVEAAPGSGIAGQGHDGADSQGFSGGGAGGGAGSAGSGFTGGSGLLSDFDGTSIEYAQGGTVGGTTASTPGSGGATADAGRDGIVIVRYEV